MLTPAPRSHACSGRAAHRPAVTFSRRGLLTACLPLWAAAPPATPFSEEQDRFLEGLSKRAFQFFWEQADASTGLVLDRSLASGGPESRRAASSAATGFGLTALCIAAERGWIARDQARARALAAHRYYATVSAHEHGWFYHFVDAHSGSRQGKCEISSIDTALLVAGMLTAAQYFAEDRELLRLAGSVYDRMDWHWMLNGDPLLLSMGWHPETGFIEDRWNRFCELQILYFLAINSRTNPLPKTSWYAWRKPVVHYAKYTYIGGVGPLFVHQFSHAWMDFRNRRDHAGTHTRWFDNSLQATLAHRQFCVDMHSKFPGYTEDIWGITASDSAHGYVAWGGPPAEGPIDGTVVPCAPGGSLMFAPQPCVQALMAMKQRYGDRIWQRYGFVDAFNPTTGWTNADVIGIDQGITLLSAENARSGNVWKWFMSTAGFRGTLDAL